MLLKMLEEFSSLFGIKRKIILGVDSHIIHVDFKPFFHNHVSTDVIHEHLEGGRCIAKAKGHDGWLI